MSADKRRFPPVDLRDVEGNNGIKEILKNTRFHSYLIYGEEGSGRHTIANRLAEAFLCEKNLAPSDTLIPCRTCRSCKKTVTGNNSDLIRIDGTVSTQEIRTALESMYFSPVEGVCRVFLFDNADKFKPQVQNVLLKAIEEPPAGNAFIFIARSPETLLETLRSRCLALRTDYTSTEDNSEDEVFENFASAALKGDVKGMLLATSVAENAAKEEKREYFAKFLRRVSDIMSREIKDAALNGNGQVLKRAVAIKEITDSIISRTVSVNVNISLWLSYTVIRINNIKTDC